MICVTQNPDFSLFPQKWFQPRVLKNDGFKSRSERLHPQWDPRIGTQSRKNFVVTACAWFRNPNDCHASGSLRLENLCGPCGIHASDRTPGTPFAAFPLLTLSAPMAAKKTPGPSPQSRDVAQSPVSAQVDSGVASRNHGPAMRGKH